MTTRVVIANMGYGPKLRIERANGDPVNVIQKDGVMEFNVWRNGGELVIRELDEPTSETK